MKSIHWLPLTDSPQLQEIAEQSHTVPCAIFKHSTRCSLSSLAENRLNKAWDFEADELKPYFLDLIANRALSNEVASFFEVPHESPQLLLIKSGRCVYESSHLSISVKALAKALEEAHSIS